jgi:hypothetical protein
MIRFSRTALLTLLLTAGASAHAATVVVPLNDTGQSLCYDSAGAAVSCATVADDGRYGRDAAVAAGALTPSSSGTKGFDFTKIANDGSPLGAGAALGSLAGEWACTRDNVTGLTWEVKTTSGLRSNAHIYTWYSADNTSNGGAGNEGDLGTDTCGGTLSAYSNQCNTANYVAAVNAAVLCGATDWRMPSLRELQSLVDFSVPLPSIDANYFPNTQSSYFWAANNYAANPANAWNVSFGGGYSAGNNKPDHDFVRLVRGGQ